jgi:hypothetical protein
MIQKEVKGLSDPAGSLSNEKIVPFAKNSQAPDPGASTRGLARFGPLMPD